MEVNVLHSDRSRLDLVGQFVEVRWSTSHAFAKKQCDQCVYVVRGLESDMICLDLAYDAIDGVHRTDSVYWVNVLSVQYLRVLTEREVERRVAHFEREFEMSRPRD